MITYPNAKINLGLNVIEKRPDGYHDIETVFIPVGLCDALEIILSPDGKTGFTNSGLSIPGNPAENLCLRAYHLISSALSFRDPSHNDLPPVRIHLHKVIPMGAGLGGGSSDGAFTLEMLDQIFGLGFSNEELADLARKLGSDCAFFLRNTPVFATGKGDQFEPVSLDLSGHFIGIVVPGIHSSTSLAYHMLTPARPPVRIPEIIGKPLPFWRKYLSNDFEEVVARQFPEIRVLKRKLYHAGAVYASMTGSGSALYGIFENRPGIKELFPGLFTWESGRLNGEVTSFRTRYTRG